MKAVVLLFYNAILCFLRVQILYIEVCDARDIAPICRGRRPDVPKGYILTELKNVGDGALDVPKGLFD